MATFPTLSITESLNYDDTTVKPIVRTKFEGNYAQTRPKYTRTQSSFNLSFDVLSDDDKETLITFFNTNSGGSFTWTHPLTAVDYTVRFMDDNLKFKRVGGGYWSISMMLEEV